MKITIILMLMLPWAIIACEELPKEEATELAGTESEDVDEEAGKIVKSEVTEEEAEAASLVDDTAVKMGNVETNMIPGSLAIGNSLALLNGDNPCAGLGFLECQPNLLKLYLSMAKQMVSVTKQMLVGADSLIKSRTGTGSFASTDSESGQEETISYDITSASLFKVLIATTEGSTMYVHVDGTDIEMMFDDTAATVSDSEEDLSRAKVKISYTDDDNFSVDVRFHMMGCDSEDVRSPERIRIRIDYAGGLRTGKAQMYMPRWMSQGDPTCEMTPSDASKTFIFTDFIGNDAATTAALHIMNNSVTDADDFSDWTFDQIPTNFAGICNGNYCMGESKPATEYVNNFCVKPETETTWSGSCSSDDSGISSGNFLAATEWLLPAGMEVLVGALPEAL